MPKLIHLMIRVADLDRSIGFYQSAFGMTESHRLDFKDFTLVYLREPESGHEIELTLNKGTDTPYTHGSGYGHVAFAVDGIEAFRDKLLALGLQPGDLKSLSHRRPARGPLLLHHRSRRLQDRSAFTGGTLRMK